MVSVISFQLSTRESVETEMKDIVTIAPLAGDPGLWTSHERIGPAEPALRRLSCCPDRLNSPKLFERWSVSPLRGL